MIDGYIIRKARQEDIGSIMFFIKLHWSEKHILALNRDFFEYQHKNDDNVSFILAEEEKTKELKAILGYVTYAKKNPDIMLALWKSIDKSNPFLGVHLLEYIAEHNNCRLIACCGINKKVVGIYQYMGYKTGILDHYYRLADKQEYKLAVVNTKDILDVHENKEYKLKEYSSFSDLLSDFNFDEYKKIGMKPYKEAWYIEKRYFEHPVYWYKIYGIENNIGQVNSVLFAREQECNGIKILRFIDFIGDINDLRFISFEVNRLICEVGYEYVDFYQHGIDKEIMNLAGFVSKKDSNNIIPNYFEPYVPENIDILYATLSEDKFIVFKGDGDQDRPNVFVKKEIR